MDRLTQALQDDESAASVQSLTAVLPQADLDAATRLYANGLDGVDPKLAPAVAGLANWDRGADLARITVVTRDAPESEAAEGLVDRVRDQYIPAAGLATTMLLLSAIGLTVPAVFHLLSRNGPDSSELTMDTEIAVASC